MKISNLVAHKYFHHKMIFGCESSHISHNVRYSVSQSVSQLVSEQMQTSLPYFGVKLRKKLPIVTLR